MNIRHEMFWGPSGSGKTDSIIELLINYLNQHPDKIARVYVGDGSKSNYLDTGLVESGRIQLFDYSTHNWPLTTMNDICEGKFPSNLNDPNSPLIAPTPDELSKIGFWVFEGASTAAQYIMGNKKGGLAEQSGRGVKVGQDSPVKVLDLDTDAKGEYIKGSGPGTTFGGNPMAHYNFAQRQILGWFERTKMLPGWVIWTAHERVGSDSQTGEKVIGPETAGQALSAGLMKYFGNTLHFTTALGSRNIKDSITDKQVKKSNLEYRIYTRDHFDPDGMTALVYRAVNRCKIPSKLPDYLTDPNPGQAIMQFYTIITEAAQEYMKKRLDKS